MSDIQHIEQVGSLRIVGPAATEVASEATGPLAGLKVIEMGQLLAGPYGGQLLGDMGADVIKIEDPKKGDPMRQWGRTLPQGQSLWWAVVGRNKQSVGIDLRTVEGQDVVRGLIANADVLIENFRPGTMERWGLGYESLSEINPRLVMARVTGYGQTGPYSSRAGYGSIGEAMGGLRHIVGDPSAPPSRMGISLGDTLAAVFATMGILSALVERSTSGRGQMVDAAIYEAVLAVMESVIPEYEVSGHVRERTGSVLPNVAPSNVYPTSDGKSVLIAANQDTVFGRLTEAMGQPELAVDSRYSDHVSRGRHQEELDRLVAEWTGTLTADELDLICQNNGIPSGTIYRAPEMLEDKHFAAREAIVRIPHKHLGEVPMQNVFPKLSRTPGSVRWVGPELGSSTLKVLSAAGITEGRLRELSESGVIG